MTSGASQSTLSRVPGCPPDKTFTRLLEGTLTDAAAASSRKRFTATLRCSLVSKAV